MNQQQQESGKMNFFPLNNSCLFCGEALFLKRAMVGVTISKEKLKELDIDLEEGDEVFICMECLPQVNI